MRDGRRVEPGVVVLIVLLVVLAAAGGAFPPWAQIRAAAFDAAGLVVAAMPDASGGRQPIGSDRMMRAPPGRAEMGPDVFRTHGCGACHAAPGIAGARGSVGPSLHGFARRSYIAGVLPNRPGDLVRWLVDPPAHAPMTAMPDLGLTRQEALDLAAWLYAVTDEG